MTTSQEAMNKLWHALADSPFVMVGLANTHQHSEPMTAKFDDEFPNQLFFYTRKDNRLLRGLVDTASTMVQFESKGHELFACMKGRLMEITDRSVVDRFWSKDVAAWFDGGKQDPALAMLRFEIDHAELWLADTSLKGRLKMMFGGNIDRRRVEDKHVTANL